MIFSCLNASLSVRLQEEDAVRIKGAYGEEIKGYKLFHSDEPYAFKHGGVIPAVDIAYETWGELDSSCSNAVLVHTGLSASSHARSHKVRHSPLLNNLPYTASASLSG